MSEANTTTPRLRRMEQHRKRTAVQRLLQKLATIGERSLTGLELFMCGCAAGILLAAMVVAAIAH